MNNPTAFPTDDTKTDGMTLRDYFAAKALQGFCSFAQSKGSPENFARWAYIFADAMLEQRSK